MRRRRVLSALFATVLAAASLTACAMVDGGEQHTCVDWVLFETPADAEESADAVVAGRLVGRAGSVTVFGEDAAVWTVAVDEWITGSGDDEIEVVSTPATCEASPPPDPFLAVEGEDRVILFLEDDEIAPGWRSLTPWQGVVPAAPDGGIPAEWPADPLVSPSPTPAEPSPSPTAG
jgi:hypothetical protein